MSQYLTVKQCTVAMLLVLPPLSFIACTVLVYVDTVTMSLIVLPFSFVDVSVSVF